MTEREWVECQDIRTLLDYLVGRASSRKFRLFGCACCRRIWPLLTDERSEAADATAGATPFELALSRTAFTATQRFSVPLYRWRDAYFPAKLVAASTRSE